MGRLKNLVVCLVRMMGVKGWKDLWVLILRFKWCCMLGECGLVRMEWVLRV